MAYGWRDIEGQQVELCDECGFDARACADDETEDLVAAHDAMAVLLEQPEADRRPGEGVWSAREYAEHCVEVTEGLLGYIGERLDRETPTGLTDLAGAAAACRAVVPGLRPDDRSAVISGVYPWDVTVQWVVRHLQHDLEHHVLDVRRNYAGLALGDSEGPSTSA